MLPTLSQGHIEGIISKYGQPKKLNLSNNGIRKIVDIIEMNGLIKLNLSTNYLNEVNGLKNLVDLFELDLSNNQLTDINGLKDLINLEVLDLRNNSLDVDSIQCLRGLYNLKHLYLEGNPLYESENYPYDIILNLLPSLETLDNRQIVNPPLPTFENNLSNKIPINDNNIQINENKIPDIYANLNSPSQNVSNSNNEQSNLERYYQHRIQTLERELIAYRDLFAAQEMSISGISKSFLNKEQMIQSDERECVYAILSLWREQTHREMVRRLMLEEREKEREKKIERENKETQIKFQQLSTSLATLSHELSQAKLLIEEQQKEIEKERHDVEVERGIRILYQQRTESLQAASNNLRTFLQYYKEKLDREMIAFQILESKIESRMLSLEGRINAARERINILETLLQMKEVELRNSQSILMAERRLFWIREQQQQQQNLHQQQNESVEFVNDNNEIELSKLRKEEIYLSDLKIPPESESLLRTIFQHLDNSDTGIVSVNMLLTCLQTAQSHGLLPYFVDIQNNSRSTPNSIWDRLIIQLQKLLHHNTLENSQINQINLTWGELLLLLVPEPFGHLDSYSILGSHRLNSNNIHNNENMNYLCICMCDHCINCEWKVNSQNYENSPQIHNSEGYEMRSRKLKEEGVYPRKPLSNSDYKSLSNAKLLNDTEWAMIPLSITIENNLLENLDNNFNLAPWLHKLSISGCCSCVGVKHECYDIQRVSKEVLRLATERAFLLKRLQFMNRSLERRAENIRGFFETELRRGENRLQKANLQLSECQSSIKEIEERFRINDLRHKTEKKYFEERLENLENENQQLHNELDLITKSRHEEISKQIDDSSQRCHRLESELKILKKELSKSEVTNKTLQRDLSRLQNSNLITQEKYEKLREEKELCKQEYHRIEEEVHRLQERLELVEVEKELMIKEQLKKFEQEKRQKENEEEHRNGEEKGEIISHPIIPLDSKSPPFRRDQNINLGKTAPMLENLSKKIRSLSDHVNRLE